VLSGHGLCVINMGIREVVEAVAMAVEGGRKP
jgi:hypothetical protein